MIIYFFLFSLRLIEIIIVDWQTFREFSFFLLRLFKDVKFQNANYVIPCKITERKKRVNFCLFHEKYRQSKGRK